MAKAIDLNEDMIDVPPPISPPVPSPSPFKIHFLVGWELPAPLHIAQGCLSRHLIAPFIGSGPGSGPTAVPETDYESKFRLRK